MTREDAEEYAKKMTYRDAINNLMKAKSIPYRKATFIKVNELLKALEQEPMVEIDLYSVIKQKYIERDVLDKIRAEIEGNMESIIGKYDSSIPKFNMPSYKIERNKAREECISIIDKYKAESEGYT